MNSQHGMPGAVRRLTAQQRHFVRAYAWEHKTKSEALRAAYSTKGNPHSVSIQAYRLMKAPHVAEAIRRAESGDWDTLIACGVDPGLLAQKKLYAMVDNPLVPDYVRERALVHVLKYKRPEPEAAEPQPTLEDIGRLLREENDRAAHDSKQEWDDDLSLDDPLPVLPAKRLAQANSFSAYSQRRREPRITSTYPGFRND